MKHPARAVATCLLGAGLLAAYAAPLAAMVEKWDTSPMYSYAYIVPPIALYLLWSRRDEIRRQPPHPARLAGALVLAGALLSLVIGQLAALQIVQQLSFLVALAGLVLFLFGRTHAWICAPALGYLLFMVPLWDVFTEPLHWPFQNNSASLGVALLHAIDIPAFREGTLIALPSLTIEVARQCSGVNYLVAVLALALPLSFLRLRTWWRRIALISSAMVIAGLANGLRVALISALAYWDIGSPLHGPFHVLHGLFVSGIGYVVLFVGLRILESRESGEKRRRAADEPASPAQGAPSLWNARVTTALAVVFWVAALAVTRTETVPVALATPLDRLPLQLGAWTIDARAMTADETPEGWSGADSHIHRRYQGPNGRSASVGIWYFESQRQDHELVNWKVAALHRQAVTRVIPLDNESLAVNIVRSDAGVEVFWYELDGVPETSQHAAKLRSLWTALTSRRSNGAVIVLRSASEGHAQDDTLQALEDLAGLVHKALARQWRPSPHADDPSRVRQSDTREERG